MKLKYMILPLVLLFGCNESEENLNSLTGTVTSIECKSKSSSRGVTVWGELTIDDKYGFTADTSYCKTLKVGSSISVEYTNKLHIHKLKYSESEEK